EPELTWGRHGSLLPLPASLRAKRSNLRGMYSCSWRKLLRRCAPRNDAERPYSHRLDVDLAELHHALAVLQRPGPLGELGVGPADHGLDAVEGHVELRALGGDLERVPLTAGLDRRRHLGDVDDRAGAVARIGPGVEDVHLVGVLRADLVRIGAADEDAAVGV